jgi:hypothetical protein
MVTVSIAQVVQLLVWWKIGLEGDLGVGGVGGPVRMAHRIRVSSFSPRGGPTSFSLGTSCSSIRLWLPIAIMYLF